MSRLNNQKSVYYQMCSLRSYYCSVRGACVGLECGIHKYVSHKNILYKHLAIYHPVRFI